MDEAFLKCRIERVRWGMMCYAFTTQSAQYELEALGIEVKVAHDLCATWCLERDILWRIGCDYKEENGE